MSIGKLRPSSRLLALLAVVPLLGACQTGLTSSDGAHWTVDSLPERMMKRFTGYRADTDGSFRDFQYRKKKDINVTLRRHFANNSADNPFEANDASQTKPRPPHSPAPDPLYYFHAESVFMGLASLGLNGSFVPVPVESILATVFGGWSEFGRGFTKGASGNAGKPPGVSKFEVKNR
jgi:hypothetical protein